MSIYVSRPRLRQLFNSISEWFFTEGLNLCYTYANRKHHYFLWRACPIRIKPDTFRRILCELYNNREMVMQKYGYNVGQENGYYWIE